MRQEKTIMETILISSDDSASTFEIRRSWDLEKKKAIIIELYPTIDADNINSYDLSTINLLNHMKDIDVGSIRILNLYSRVQTGKPTVSCLSEDLDNLAYISDVFDEKDIAENLIIIGWGSSLSKNRATIISKVHILKQIIEKKLVKNTMQLFTENLDTNSCVGCHPLYMGLHFGKDNWTVIPYPVESELKALSAIADISNPVISQTKKRSKAKCIIDSKTDSK